MAIARNIAEKDAVSFVREFAERVGASFVEGGITAAVGLWGGGGLGVNTLSHATDEKKAILTFAFAIITAATSAAYNTGRALLASNRKRLTDDAGGIIGNPFSLPADATVTLTGGVGGGSYGGGGAGHASQIPKPPPINPPAGSRPSPAPAVQPLSADQAAELPPEGPVIQ